METKIIRDLSALHKAVINIIIKMKYCRYKIVHKKIHLHLF